MSLGSLTPERDLTFVEDTVAGFIAVAECDRAIGQVINVGTGSAISVGDLARKLVDAVNPKARIVSVEERVRPTKARS